MEKNVFLKINNNEVIRLQIKSYKLQEDCHYIWEKISVISHSEVWQTCISDATLHLHINPDPNININPNPNHNPDAIVSEWPILCRVGR